MSDIKLIVKGLSYSYEDNLVLSNIELTVKEKEFVSILGLSGCGKSTLLNILAGIISADSGSILVDNEVVRGLSTHFAYMPQQDLLLSWKNILDNVSIYGKIHGIESEINKKALPLFTKFGLAGYEKKYPSELSGGMRQRAAFLRTAMCNADILLLDEPFGALDIITREDMQKWLIKMSDDINKTTILVTHDIDEALYLSDRILIMDGKPVNKFIEIKKDDQRYNRDYILQQLHKGDELV